MGHRVVTQRQQPGYLSGPILSLGDAAGRRGCGECQQHAGAGRSRRVEWPPGSSQEQLAGPFGLPVATPPAALAGAVEGAPGMMRRRAGPIACRSTGCLSLMALGQRRRPLWCRLAACQR